MSLRRGNVFIFLCVSFHFQTVHMSVLIIYMYRSSFHTPICFCVWYFQQDKDPQSLLFCPSCVCVYETLPFSAHSVCHDKCICLCFTGWHRLQLAGTVVLAPRPRACVCAQPSDSFPGSLHPRSPHPPTSPLQMSSQAGAATRTPCPLRVLLSGLYLPPSLSLDLPSCSWRQPSIICLCASVSLFASS